MDSTEERMWANIRRIAESVGNLMLSTDMPDPRIAREAIQRDIQILRDEINGNAQTEELMDRVERQFIARLTTRRDQHAHHDQSKERMNATLDALELMIAGEGKEKKREGSEQR